MFPRQTCLSFPAGSPIALCTYTRHTRYCIAFIFSSIRPGVRVYRVNVYPRHTRNYIPAVCSLGGGGGGGGARDSLARSIISRRRRCPFVEKTLHCQIKPIVTPNAAAGESARTFVAPTGCR